MDFTAKRTQVQIKNHKQNVLDDKGHISLTSIFESERFQTIINECREFKDRIYTPMVTLLIFIKQVLNPDKSCKKAVANFVAGQLSKGYEDVPSTNTGPYCKARQRLPEKSIRELVKVSGESSIKKASTSWKVYGREVKMFDGTTVKMADTDANQNIYPQHSNQKKGAGFPIARLLVVVSLTVGTVIDYAIGACKGKGTGELSLLRDIWGAIKQDDIVLGDRYFPCFFIMADLRKTGADGIFRGQSQRHYDFRTGSSLGKNEHIVFWSKPKKPNWMSQTEYDAYPEKIQIREFKVNGNIYVTTFLDPKKQHKKELAKIYKLRWHIEINLNSIKTIMNMDMLSCKTPEMVRKEIGVHLLAYNMIRIIMAEACQKHDATPLNVSFKGTVQLLDAFMPHFLNSSVKECEKLYANMLSLIINNKIGNRPGRIEPRLVKQRKKPFKTLNKPRSVERKKLIKKVERKIKKYAAA